MLGVLLAAFNDQDVFVTGREEDELIETLINIDICFIFCFKIKQSSYCFLGNSKTTLFGETNSSFGKAVQLLISLSYLIITASGY